MAQALYGRDIPYVLLLHIGAFDARLLASYQSRGFRFVTLVEAAPHTRPGDKMVLDFE